MKATVDIPNDLYRRVKAKSALEGRPVREVTVQLFRGWVDAATPSVPEDKALVRKGGTVRPQWLGSLRRYAGKARGRHDMKSIRNSIARGRAAEWAEREGRG
jgi:hypothetical protein